MISRRITLVVVMLCMAIKVSAYYQEKPKVLNNEDFSSAIPTESVVKEDEKEPFITMERTSCFGRCPVYKLTIYRNGMVIYEGKDFVTVKGKKTIVINIDKIKELKADIERAKYYSLKDKYEGGPTDSASVILTIATAGKKKSINHYLASPESPDELKELEDEIDSAVNTFQWIQ